MKRPPIPCPDMNCVRGAVEDTNYEGRSFWTRCETCNGNGYLSCVECRIEPAVAIVDDQPTCRCCLPEEVAA